MLLMYQILSWIMLTGTFLCQILPSTDQDSKCLSVNVIIDNITGIDSAKHSKEQVNLTGACVMNFILL